jgi:MFS family permease
VLLFYFVPFIAAFCLGINILDSTILLIEKFEISAFLLGIVGGIRAFFYSVFAVSFGRVYDGGNYKRLALTASALYALVWFSVPWINALHLLLILLCGFSPFAMGMFWPSLIVWFSHKAEREKLTETLGIFNISWCIGITGGSFIGGFLLKLGYWLPFTLSSIFMLTNLLILFILSGEPLFLAPTHDSGRRSPTLSEKENNNQNFLYIGWIANFIYVFIATMIRALFPKLAYSLNINPQILGILLAIFSFAQGSMFLILRKKTFWHYRLLPILIFQTIALLGILGIILGKSPYIFGPAFLLFGIFGGISYFSSIFYSVHFQKGRGQRAGLHEGVMGSGALFGPLLGGIFAHYFGLKAPYVLALILLGVGIVVEAKIGRVLKRDINLTLRR